MIITRKSGINCNKDAKFHPSRRVSLPLYKTFNLEEEVKKFHLPKDQENTIYESVVRAAAHKGYPYSETEFNCASEGIRCRLEEKQGPAAAGIYEFLLDQMPVKGGRFNHYSGD